jgi:[acyl-carrier-protein] S-malonyltransferase
MCTPWLELDGVEQRLSGWSAVIGLDLVRLGTTADAEEIKDTGVTQPLVVALSLIAAEQLRRRVELPPETVVAGHSVGELAAAAIAGVLTADDAVALAAVRGREMAAACALEPTGMSAVLSGDPDEVVTYLDQLGLTAANHNGAGQIVAAGPLPALAKLNEQPPAGAKVRALPVAGAFHTHFMRPAQNALSEHAKAVRASDAELTLLTNADGSAVPDGDDFVRHLIEQVTRPVRWDACMATMAARGVRATVEFPPAGTLTGLVRRELKETHRVALKTPDHLDAVAELFDNSVRDASTTDIGSPA